VGVLNLGGRVSPPASVQGRWLLKTADDLNPQASCLYGLVNSREPTIDISQSGIFLDITVLNASGGHLLGRLEGDQLVAETSPPFFGRENFDLLRISATLSREDGQTTLRGSITAPRRTECASALFVATLSPKRAHQGR